MPDTERRRTRKRESHTHPPRLTKRQLGDMAAAMNGGCTERQAERLMEWGLLDKNMVLTDKGSNGISRALRELLASRQG